MSGARDQAIAVIADMLPESVYERIRIDWAGGILDAIPADVLAQLAIERGGLEDAGSAGYREYGDYVVVPGDAHWALGTPVKVYRLVTS